MTRAMWAAVTMLLLISPVLSVFAAGPIELNLNYLDVPRFEQYVPPNTAVVAGWQQDFIKFMRYSQNRNIHYYYLLDWPTALGGPRSFVLDYHLMEAYRNNGYYAKNIQDNHDFLCAHPDFFVLDAPNTVSPNKPSGGDPDMKKPTWFDVNIRPGSQFEWKAIASFDGVEVTRNLVSVHRKSQLPFCHDTGGSGQE